MPSGVSVLAPSIPWDHETFWPAKPDSPLAAGTTTSLISTVADSRFGWRPQAVSSFQVGGATNTQLCAANRWCLRLSSPALTDSMCYGRRFTQWCPYLDQAIAPADGGDPASRVGWMRFNVLAGLDAVAGATVDSLGISLVADNGLGFNPVTWVASSDNGFGIFKRAGTSLWRYASYGPGHVLLESTNLPSANGWHTADFIFRQAKRGDATTPWLTFQWDGVDIITQRVFGHALLPTPQSLRVSPHGWAFLLGPYLTSGDLSVSMECRMGGRLPNGVPVT